MKYNSLFRKKALKDVAYDFEGKDASSQLNKSLRLRDIVSFGLAAVIGAGIFSTIGKASADAGPSVVLLFVFSSLTCAFCALAYAEFASIVRVSGSAYTYCYVSLGEMIAWIIGWALILEYAFGNITIAFSWSDYLSTLLRNVNVPALGIEGIHFPSWLQTDFFSAKNGFDHAQQLLLSGQPIDKLDGLTQNALQAWNQAPMFLGLRIIFDLPALFMIALITVLVYRGIKESKKIANGLVVTKMLIILAVVVAGVFYIDVQNWSEFAPNGFGGITSGIGAVFFAYIGFDSLSTISEECKNPQRDLPRGMIITLILSTILYVIVSLILTGVVFYDKLSVGDPLSFVFQEIGLDYFSSIIALSGLIALTGVFLVFQIGQPRIWMTMSRDGLLPKAFSRIHPKYKTPSFATIFTGIFVGIPALFLNMDIVTDLTSLGTLLAFALVCGGLLVLQQDPDYNKKVRFKTPFVNAKFVYPFILLFFLIFSFTWNQENTINFLSNEPQVRDVNQIVSQLSTQEINQLKDASFLQAGTKNLNLFLNDFSLDERVHWLSQQGVAWDNIYQSGISLFFHKVPNWIFIILTFYLLFIVWVKRISLIPLLGLLSSSYLISEMGLVNWIVFFIWLAIGLIIYLLYSAKNSKLNAKTSVSVA